MSSISRELGIMSVFLSPSMFQTLRVVSLEEVTNVVSLIQLISVTLLVCGRSVIISLISSPVFPSYRNILLSEELVTKKSPFGLNLVAKTKLVCCFDDFLNLNGGPSYQHTENSSPPTINRNGLIIYIQYL